MLLTSVIVRLWTDGAFAAAPEGKWQHALVHPGPAQHIDPGLLGYGSLSDQLQETTSIILLRVTAWFNKSISELEVLVQHIDTSTTSA